MDQCLGEFAQGDVPLGDQHRAGQAGPGAEGGGRGRGVAGGRADHRLRPILHGLGDGHRHPPVLERAGGVGPLDLQQHPRADPGRQARCLEQRGPALEQRHDGRVGRDGQELAVLLDHPAPGQRPVVGGHAVPTIRITPPIRSTESSPSRSARVARRSPSRATWVTKTRRAPSPPPSCSTDRIDTPWSPNAVVDGAEDAGAVDDVEADVEPGLEVVGGHEVGRLAVGCRGGRAGEQVARGVDEVPDHGARRGQAAGALAVEHELTGRLALDEDGVEGVAHPGQRMGRRGPGPGGPAPRARRLRPAPRRPAA